MAKKISTLDLTNNKRVDQGFIDGAGVREIKDVTFDIERLDINKQEGSMDIYISFEANNFRQIRRFRYEAADIPSAGITKLLSILDDALNFVINEEEFKNKTTDV